MVKLALPGRELECEYVEIIPQDRDRGWHVGLGEIHVGMASLTITIGERLWLIPTSRVRLLEAHLEEEQAELLFRRRSGSNCETLEEEIEMDAEEYHTFQVLSRRFG